MSLYVLNPRDTYLRRSREEPLRSPSNAPLEVWQGKGLVSWALEEQGEGKNLITGRIVRRAEFTGFTTVTEGVCALEALAAANSSAGNDDGQAWGIEVAVGLKSGMTGLGTFPGPLHQTVERGIVAAHAGSLARPLPRQQQQQPHPQSEPVMGKPPLQRAPSHGLPRISPMHRLPSSASKPTSGRAGAPIQPTRGRPRKRSMDSDDRALSSIDLNLATPRTDGSLVIPKPEEITPEQAALLLKDPSFLQMLEGMTGAPISAMVAEQRQTDDDDVVTKRARFDDTDVAPELRCSNCSTTRSSVWRTKKGDDGQSVRVCNACGLWFNKQRTMRPKELWTTGDEEPVRRGRHAKAKKEKEAAAAKEKGFKRTLTQVVEKDARRIADMRKTTKTPAPRGRPPKAVPATSPSRAPAPKAVRNAKFAASTAVAASSPGGYARSIDNAHPSTPASTTTPMGPTESPNTVLRRILDSAMPSLALPLSDDGSGAANSTVDWNPDLSAFFNVDGFAMSGSARVSPQQRVSEVTVSSALRKQVSADDDADPSIRPASSEDDVFSQLFQRTSSVGDFDASSHTSSPFDFSQLPPSSPPSLPSNLPHSALLLSSPSGSPAEYSPRADSDTGGKVSPTRSGSGLRNELSKASEADGDVIKELLSKIGGSNVNDLAASGNMNEELLALFNSFPASTA